MLVFNSKTKQMTDIDNDDAFYSGSSKDFLGEKPDGTPVSGSENGHSSKIGCLAVVAIIIVGI